MTKQFAKAVLLGLCLSSSVLMTPLPALAEDAPSLHQIYEAAHAGRMREARAMMQQVLQSHPNSAKAHYVNAELLAASRDLSSARAELSEAERLAPGLPFAPQKSVLQLEKKLDSGRSQSKLASMSPPSPSPSPLPWVLLLLGIGLAAISFLLIRKSRQRPPGYAAPAAGPANIPSGQMPTAGPAGFTPQPGLGSSLVSGLATGVAVGAGMAAGEALAEHFIGGHAATPNAGVSPAAPAWQTDPQPLDTPDFGIQSNDTWDDADSGSLNSLGDDDWS
jgi:hypothetical protein